MIKTIYRFLHPRFQALFLEYPVDMKPRHGHGAGPALAGLLEIVEAARPRYRTEIAKLVKYREQLAHINTSDVETDAAEPAYNNGFLPGLDIAALYGILAENRPRRYVEIGSGNSTKVAHRVRRDLGLNFEITSIDPAPRAEIDQLADRTLIGGAYQKLKNIFAYGDEKGLQKNFPYRIGHRGFHYPEAIAFCVERISESDYPQVQAYFDGRDSRTKGFFKKRALMPTTITQKLLPEILECTLYFCQRQPNLLARLCTPNYLRRELIFMDNPQVEEVLSWLTQLTLSIFKGSNDPAIKEDLKDLDIETDTPMMLELKELIKDEA